MSIQPRAVPLTSGEILKELVIDSLPHLLGESCELITHNLPFEGNPLVALDAEQRPAVITFDHRDGGRALLTGLTAVEGLTANRAMLYRLYPALFRGNRHNSAIFRIEDIRLIVLAPTPPPGGTYLEQTFRSLTVCTFRILEVGGEIGLLIEPPQRPGDHTGPAGEYPGMPAQPVFRAGRVTLSAEEEHYFQET